MKAHTRPFSIVRGFTLIELLVVVSIIGLLSSVILASLSTARAKARDARRRADIDQIALAAELYYDKHGSYYIAGSGYWDGVYRGSYALGACGCGFFDLQYSSSTQDYQLSIAHALINDADLPASSIDPLNPPTDPSSASLFYTTASYYYMYYVSGDGQHFAIFAKLENPTASELANSAPKNPELYSDWVMASSTYGRNVSYFR